MLNSITIGRYYNTNSIVHNINPFIKLICLMLSCISIIILDNIYLIIPLSILIFIYMSSTKVTFKHYIKMLKYVILFILAIGFINFLFNKDIGLFMLDIFKIVSLIFLSFVVLFTTTIDELILGFYIILSPLKKFKINIDKLVLILTFGIKFIPIILNSTNTVFESLYVKGMNIKNGNFEHKFKTFKIAIVPIFKSTLKKADKISYMLELRCFDVNNIYDGELNLEVRDLVLLDIHLLVLLGVILCVI